ncbi:MAG: gluconokinase [Egibacteraceae bacterium]
MSAPAVIGLDLGTSSAKAVAFDAGGRALAAHAVEVGIASPAPDRAEQNPDELVGAAEQATAAVVRDLSAQGRTVVGLGCSGAMHSLLALDGAGRPLTPVILFADNRAAAQARQLAARPSAVALARRTGTPIHPMSPLAKLRWFAECDQQTVAAARWWVSAKEYLIRKLCAAEVVDHSVASATGLLNLASASWDEEALALARIDADVLSTPVPTTTVLHTRRARLGLPAGTPVVVGASDGCLATLGVGATGAGVAALTVGTSGALRTIVDRPGTDAQARLFCYALTEARWVVGGPISSGGIVLRWARDRLFPELAGAAGQQGAPGSPPSNPVYVRFDELAAGVPPGADGLLCLPYLLGERAPLWDPQLRGAFFGLSLRHGQGHVLRALLEGVAFQLATVLEPIEELGHPVATLRADGGFTRSRLWLQIMADVLGRPLELPRTVEGACRGAALLTLEALGLGDAFALAGATRVEHTITPDPATAATYRDALDRFVKARDRLLDR